MAERLQTEIGPLSLRNPLLSASGTFGYGEEIRTFVDPSVYGGIIGKSISEQPRVGNPTPRTWETPAGMLNSIGLQNPGIDVFLESYLPRMERFDTRIVVNLVGDSIEEYARMAARLEEKESVDAIELNISCPNCAHGGMEFGIEPVATQKLVEAVRASFSRTIIAKLTPNVTDITPIALAAEAGGADALSLINTYVGMAVDWRARKPRLAGVTGGLSGPAIKPLALRLVWLAARACEIPIIAIGGIMNADDVLDFLVTGAAAVQLGTVQFIRPRIAIKILEDLETAMDELGVSKISEIVGTLETEREAITVTASQAADRASQVADSTANPDEECASSAAGTVDHPSR